ncbi:MAG: hypothetical protein ACXVBE_11950 [Bdellovibrionota bacterium]
MPTKTSGGTTTSVTTSGVSGTSSGTDSRTGSSTASNFGSARPGAPAAASQTGAQIEAANVSEGASEQAVSIGIASCAEGANAISTNPAASGTLIGSCLDSFAAASQLKDVQGAAAKNADTAFSSELAPNDALLESENSKKIFSDLEKKYGTDKDDFSKKLIAARGDPEILGTQESLDDLFNGKVSREQVDEAVAAAGGLSATERQAILDNALSAEVRKEAEAGLIKETSGRSMKIAVGTKLRDSLISKLDNSNEASRQSYSYAGRKPASSRAPSFQNLQPMEHPPFAVENEDEQSDEASVEGSTLFDVVHRKYQEELRGDKI